MMIKQWMKRRSKTINIYQAIVIKGYKLKHLSSTKYTDGVFAIILFIHIQFECFNGWSSYLWISSCVDGHIK